MSEESKTPRNLKELREELAALTRLSAVTITEIARIQRRIQALSQRLNETGREDPPAGKGDRESQI